MSDKSGIIKGAVNFKFQVCQGFLSKHDFQLIVTDTLLCVNSVLLQMCAFLAVVEMTEKLELWINLKNIKWIHTSVLSRQGWVVALWICKHSNAGGDGAESELWQQTGRRGSDNVMVLLHDTYPHQKHNFKIKKAALNHTCHEEDSTVIRQNLEFGYKLLFELRSQAKHCFQKLYLYQQCNICSSNTSSTLLVTLTHVVVVVWAGVFFAVQQEPWYNMIIWLWWHCSSETEPRNSPLGRCHDWERCNVCHISSAEYHFLSQIPHQPLCTWVEKVGN